MIFNEKGLLPAIDIDDIGLLALKTIKEEKVMEHGLICRWSSVNRAILKNWRFKTLYTLAGSSGSGKSYMLNMLRSDLTDTQPIELEIKGLSKELIYQLTELGEFNLVNDKLIRYPLNGDYKHPILWLNFEFDMAPEVDMLRTAAIMCGTNYSHLLSSEATEVDGVTTYNKVTEEETYIVGKVIQQYCKTRPNIINIREPGSIRDMQIMVDRYANKYPNHKIVISRDHTLLVKKENVHSDLELLNEQIKVDKDIRDLYGAMVIPLTQMNSDIEDDRRRLSPNLHYPMKSDLYCGGQIFQSSDYVFTAFMPASINLTKYGPRGIPTKNLIHFGLIKSRHGTLANMWFINGLDHGQIYSTKIPRDNLNEKMLLEPIKTLINQPTK